MNKLRPERILRETGSKALKSISTNKITGNFTKSSKILQITSGDALSIHYITVMR